jgi:septum site-determining protein MinD
VEDALEILSIPLLGIIPESREVMRTSNIGEPVTTGSPDSAPARAYLEAAKRLNGDIEGAVTVSTEKPSFFAKMFARKAA